MPTLYFDEDCSVCTQFAHIIGRLRPQIRVVSMASESGNEGLRVLGANEYWKSFHMVVDGHWTTEGEAIAELSGQFPFGTLWKRIVSIGIINKLSVQLLRHFQRMRKMECSVNYQA